MEYAAAAGAHFSNSWAVVLGKQFERIAKREFLTPEAVLEDARKKKSPIHSFFEWDDAVAGEEYRKKQAGHYLRTVVVIQEEDERPVRAFHVITGEDSERSYQPLEVVLNDAEMMRQVIERARRELVSWSQRHRQYEELADAQKGVQLAIEALEPVMA